MTDLTEGPSYPTNHKAVQKDKEWHQQHDEHEAARQAKYDNRSGDDARNADVPVQFEAWQQKALPNTGMPRKAGGTAAPEPYSKEWMAAQLRKPDAQEQPQPGHHKYSKEERAQQEATFQEYEGSQKGYHKPIKVPKLTLQEMQKFSPALAARIGEFEDDLRLAEGQPEAAALKHEFTVAFGKALGIYQQQMKNLSDDLQAFEPNSNEGKQELSEGRRSISSASSMIEFAIKHSQRGDFEIAANAFRSAHIDLAAALTSVQIVASDIDAVRSRQIQHWTTVRAACEAALTLCGGALEACAAKVALAAAPALAKLAEKASLEWNGVPNDITWAGAIAQGLIDVGFAHAGKILDMKYFGGIDYAANVAWKDPNTKLFFAKHSYSITQSLIKELLSRLKDRKLREHYGMPKEKLPEAAAEAAWREYTLDTNGGMLQELIKLAMEAEH